MRSIVERLVEVHQGARALEAVTSKLDFRHGVDVLNKELETGAGRATREPHVEVLVLARLEEDNVVAVLHISEVISGGKVVYR
jgi:hypothetical protein